MKRILTLDLVMMVALVLSVNWQSTRSDATYVPPNPSKTVDMITLAEIKPPQPTVITQLGVVADSLVAYDVGPGPMIISNN